MNQIIKNTLIKIGITILIAFSMVFLNVYLGFFVAMSINVIAISIYLKRQRHLWLFVTMVAVSVPINATIVKCFMFHIVYLIENESIIVIMSILVYLLLLLAEEIAFGVVGKIIWRK